MSEKKSENTSQNERDQQSDFMVDFLNRIEAEKVLGTEKEKRDFIKGMSFEAFEGWLKRINGILRSVPLAKRGFDGKEVALVPNPAQENKLAAALGGERKTEFPPREQDKEALLKEMFDLAKQMEARGDSLADISLLMSAGINAVHTFEDGNGRTSRFLNYLLANDYVGSEDQADYLKKLLGDKGRLLVNIDPGEAKDAVADYIFSHQLGIEPEDKNLPDEFTTFSPGMPRKKVEEKVEEKVPPEFLADFKKHIIDEGHDFGFFAIYSFLKDEGRLDDFLSHLKAKANFAGRTDLRVVDVVSGLKTEDYPEILERYWKFKKEGVSILMQAVAEPDKFKIDKGQYPHHSGKTIKEIFLSNLDASYLRSFKEVNMENISDIWEEKDELSFSVDTISQEEMEQLASINRRLQEFAEQERQERQSLGFDENQAEQEYKKAYDEIETEDERGFKASLAGKDTDAVEYSGLSKDAQKRAYEAKCKIYKPILDLENRYLDQTVQFLDSFDIWKTKFTTRDEGQFASEEEKETNDSIYYVTRNGQSLRLRKYGLLKDGLAGSIEPFMEKIFFVDKQWENRDDKTKVSDEAEEGYFVREYVTDEFITAQNKPIAKRFNSRIRRYEKDGTTIYLNPVDGSRHRGNAVHKILNV